MGSEGSGISRLVRDNCDYVVSIPMRGHIDSLNVSVAAGVLLYEVRRNS
jgi:23S rRNA (guanosine2251-2'-O)-methyltransferase